MAPGLAGAAVLAAAVAAPAWAKSDGTCGYQCRGDAECGGCGRAGRCSCPDGLDVSFHEISCSCVSAPADPPADPSADIKDSAWPDEWTATVDAWCYGDFSEKTSVASGKFYFNSKLGRTRAEWSPYISGKDALQVWVGTADGKQKSMYYVKSGPICLKFPITDPGVSGKPAVGVEKPDWMVACKEAGFGKYIGREQVRVGDEDVWADHWSCRLDYEAANQSITFQNWHSLGLGSFPKGLPLRVTGGNSAPNPTRGSPRLNTVWYHNFTVGEGSTQPSDFDPPGLGGKLCIPVGLQDVQAFFGHRVEAPHAFSPAFHRRAHFLPHAKASASDLRRARRPQPSRAFKGNGFGHAMRTLNAQLLRERNLQTKACRDFTLAELQQAQRLLFDARTPELDQVYTVANDTRRMAHGSAEALEEEQRRHRTLHPTSRAAAVAQDGACHELVMWYVHHLSEPARAAVRPLLVLPLLPEVQHDAPPRGEGEAHDEVHRRYKEQVSCAICHVMGASDASPVPPRETTTSQGTGEASIVV